MNLRIVRMIGIYAVFAIAAAGSGFQAPKASDVAFQHQDLSFEVRPTYRGFQRAGTGGEVRGRVYDAKTGSPFVGAKVVASRFTISHKCTATTDGQGNYSIHLEAGNWWFDLEGPGIRDEKLTRYVTMIDGTTIDGLDFELDLGRAVWGVVESPAGEPLPGARIKGAPQSDPWRTSIATADSQGRFVLGGFDAGDAVRMVAFMDRYSESEIAAVEVDTPSSTGVRLRLRVESQISGVLVDPMGRPAPGGKVRTFPPRDRGFLYETSAVRVDGDGHFVLKGIPPGTHDLCADRARALHTSLTWDPYRREVVLATVEVNEGQRLEGVRLVLPDDGLGSGSVDGTILAEDGTPVPQATVSLYTYKAGLDGTTDEFGRFRIDGLGEGLHGGEVRAPGFKDLELKSIPVPSSGHTWFMTPVGRIRGRVVDGLTGEPIPVFAVCSNPPVGGNAIGNARWEWIEQDDGTFELPEFHRENSKIGVTSKGYRPQFVTIGPPGQTPPCSPSMLDGRRIVEMTANSVVEVDFELLPAKDVAGIVVDAEGRPVADAQFFRRQPDKLNFHPALAVGFGRPDGTFLFEDLIGSNPIVLYAFGPGHWWSKMEVSWETDQPLRIELPEGRRLTGRVVFRGRPLSGCQVQLYTRPPHQKRTAVSDVYGRFTFTNLQPSNEGSVSTSYAYDARTTYAISTPVIVYESKQSETLVSLAAHQTTIEGIFEGIAPGEGVSLRAEVKDAIEGRCTVTVDMSDDLSYHVGGLPPGELTLTARARIDGEDEELEETVLLAEDMPLGVNFDFGKIIKIYGHVQGGESCTRISGAIYRGTHEAATTPEGWQSMADDKAVTFRVDDRGDFTARLLEPGTYTFILSCDGRSEVRPLQVAPADTVRVDFDLASHD